MLPFTCSYCGENFCSEHRLTHNCVRYSRANRGIFNKKIQRRK
ncbi:AN1-type zinc finger domain-containing protein [Candidatus Bathyarchaeota archaeon]|nr:AN1-type zinc finger domain-containing protein [Candidatus Bathyarchaeota archaeon]